MSHAKSWYKLNISTHIYALLHYAVRNGYITEPNIQISVERNYQIEVNAMNDIYDKLYRRSYQKCLIQLENILHWTQKPFRNMNDFRKNVYLNDYMIT